MLEPVLNALAYIHGERFVHGHLTPANIMAVSDQLKISCDGICKMGESAPDPREPDVYDPPEFRATGISPAADVWSLGMTLVEALTQCLPNQGSPAAESLLPETVPAVFRGIVADCCSPTPGSARLWLTLLPGFGRPRPNPAERVSLRHTSHPGGRVTWCPSPRPASHWQPFLQASGSSVGQCLRPFPNTRIFNASRNGSECSRKRSRSQKEPVAKRKVSAGSAPSLAPLRPEPTLSRPATQPRGMWCIKFCLPCRSRLETRSTGR